MTQTNQLIDLTSATLARGQRAWKQIKLSAVEQRELWRQVGQALIVGKNKDVRGGKKFSEWAQEMFHGIDVSNTVPAAIWLAENFVRCTENCPAELTHPKHIRDWFNEQQLTTSPTPEVGITESDTPRPRITIETAKKVNKLAAMAEGGEGQEKATAQKYLKKQAEKLGTNAETLSNLAKKTDPMYGLTPDQQEEQQVNLQEAAKLVMNLVALLQETQSDESQPKLTREVIIALLDNVCDARNVL